VNREVSGTESCDAYDKLPDGRNVGCARIASRTIDTGRYCERHAQAIRAAQAAGEAGPLTAEPEHLCGMNCEHHPPRCPYCGLVMSNREKQEQGACNDCSGGAYGRD